MGISAAECQGSALFSRLLSRLFLEVPDIELLEELASLDLIAAWPFELDDVARRGFAEISAALSVSNPEALRRGLRDEHMRLFIGPGMPLVPLWGSVYLDEENLLLGESSRAVESFLRNAGLVPMLKDREPLDHLGLLLSALAVLLERLAAGPDDAPALALVRQFLAVHLGPWLPRCLRLLEERAQSSFYTGLERLTTALFKGLLSCCNARPEEKQLYY